MSGAALTETFSEVLSVIQHERDKTYQFDSTVTCVAACSGGVVLGLESGTVVIATIDASVSMTVLATAKGGHSKAVDCLAVSLDGLQVVSGSRDGAVLAWSIPDGKEFVRFKRPSDEVVCVAVTSDREKVVSGSEDGAVHVWSLSERREEAKLEGHTGSVRCLAVTPDGAKVVTGGTDLTVRVWSLTEFKEEGKMEGHFDSVACLAISPDGLRVVSGGVDCSVRVWSLSTHQEEARFSGHFQTVTCVAMTPDCSRVVSASDDHSVRVWNLAEMKEEAKLDGHLQPVRCMAITADGSRVVTGSEDCTARFYTLTARREHSQFSAHTESIRCVAITPDGGRIVIGASDNSVRVWNFAERREEARLEGHRRWVNDLAVSPDGLKVVSVSSDQTVRVWTVEGPRNESTLDCEDSVSCVGVTPDGSRVAYGSRDGSIHVWNVSKLGEKFRLGGHIGNVTCLAVTCDGFRVVTGGEDATVRVWNLAQRREEIKLEGHQEWVMDVVATPDSSRVVSVSFDQTVRVWNLAGRREETLFEGHSKSVTCVAITRDGQRAVTGSSDRSVRVWNLQERREEMVLTGVNDAVTCIAVTPDGSMVVCGADDGEIHCWPLEVCTRTSRKVLATASDLRSAISACAQGKLVPIALAECVIPSYFFNALHVCAYFNKWEQMQEYLSAGVMVIRGCFGTPLTLAIQRNSGKCVDVILRYFIKRLEGPHSNDSIWPEFDPITEDLPALLCFKSSLLQRFFSLLMQFPAAPALPDFFNLSLPKIAHLPSRLLTISDFEDAVQTSQSDENADKQEIGVATTLISLPRWDFTAGTKQSLRMLSAFAECNDKHVLETPYVSAIIEAKWTDFFPFTLTTVLCYSFLLISLLCIIFHHHNSYIYIGSFLAFNIFFLLCEFSKMLSGGLSYFSKSSNWTELIRLTICGCWIFLLLTRYRPFKKRRMIISFTVTVLCFIRGFSMLRCCSATRLFAAATIDVAKQLKGFIGVLAFAVIALVAFQAILLKFDSFELGLILSYIGMLGELDDNFYYDDFTDYLVFIAATIVFIVLWLAFVLILFSEVWSKRTVSNREKELSMQLAIILEWETIMFWRQYVTSLGSVIATITKEENTEVEAAVQSERIDVAKSVTRSVEEKFERVEEQVARMESKISGVEEQLKAIAGLLRSRK